MTTPRTGPVREAARSIALRNGAQTDYADQAGPRPVLATAGQRGVLRRSSRWPSGSATAFLGVRIECAQCHKHPFDRWTPGRLSRVRQHRRGRAVRPLARRPAPPRPRCLRSGARLIRNGALPPIPGSARSISQPRSSRRLADPDTGRPLAPAASGGPELPEGGDPRERLFAWLTRPDNPYFARSFVNRVWAVYFGAGLVDPVDGFSVANPPSNPRLLDALAADFVAHGYDIRRLERTILNSRAYQRSSEPVAGNLDDRGNFAAVDAAAHDGRGPRRCAQRRAWGRRRFRLRTAPKGARAIEIATNRVASPDLARAFRVFGRPERTAVCDCERPRRRPCLRRFFS